MINKTGLLIAIAALSTACSQPQPVQQHSETPECRAWRTMMTAPMPTDAHNRLKTACEKSMMPDGRIRHD